MKKRLYIKAVRILIEHRCRNLDMQDTTMLLSLSLAFKEIHITNRMPPTQLLPSAFYKNQHLVS
ncbi:MAG: hypothetical protein ACE5NM_10415, partial [Sedimentisphaerales bacterium]